MEEEDEEESICFGLVTFRKQAPRLSADDVLDRLRKLSRALHAQIAGYEHDEKEERLEAKMYLEQRKPPDLDSAKAHLRLALMHQETKKRELAKYENLKCLISQMEEARRNLSLANSMVESRDLLQSLTRETEALNLEEVMDALRDYLAQVRDQNEVLTEPLLFPSLLEEEEKAEKIVPKKIEVEKQQKRVALKNV